MDLIAIFGGSFDPIHLGHLQMAQSVQSDAHPVATYFVPCGQPVHRLPTTTPRHHRLAMLELALQPYPHFHIDTLEMDSPHPSYTLNTLQSFRQRFPDQSLGFILGMDTFLTLDSAWGKQWWLLLEFAHLLLVPRANVPACESSVLRSFLKKHRIDDQDFLHKQHNGAIMLLKEAPAPISSTSIRKKIAENESTASLLPKAVYDYIQQHRLYR